MNTPVPMPWATKAKKILSLDQARNLYGSMKMMAGLGVDSTQFRHVFPAEDSGLLVWVEQKKDSPVIRLGFVCREVYAEVYQNYTQFGLEYGVISGKDCLRLSELGYTYPYTFYESSGEVMDANFKPVARYISGPNSTTIGKAVARAINNSFEA